VSGLEALNAVSGERGGEGSLKREGGTGRRVAGQA